MKRCNVMMAVICLSVNAMAASAAEPIQVFILAGQSNMEGQAVVDLEGKDYNNGRGTLKSLLSQPEKQPLVRHLRQADGTWTVRDDVWCRYQRERGPLLAGKLSVGFSVYGGKHHFGPELQFGHVVGEFCEQRVVLIKTCWGGKSLYQDFRPPSSGGETGPYYTRMIADVREALQNLQKELGLDGAAKLAGFVWYHGWNDGVDPKRAVPEYEQNLVNLIQDVRKEFETPDLPVVVGELTGPWVEAPESWEQLRAAQRAAAERPELGRHVRFVPTRQFVRKPEDSPNPTHGHHEFGNAETYFLVGDALGKGMVSLLNRPPVKAPPAQDRPAARVAQQLEGWTIRVDDRLLGDAAEAELGKHALRFLEGRLIDIKTVVPADRVRELQKMTIVLDLNCGDLGSMQYHPSAGWLKEHGYTEDLAKCVHLPRAADVATKRNTNEQPWCILHELAHAYHDQKLNFEEPRIKAAFERYKESGHGDATLLFDGRRVKHYALTNQMEFFAEMTEAYFGVNDFYPFVRAEMIESEPELYKLLSEIWAADAVEKD